MIKNNNNIKKKQHRKSVGPLSPYPPPKKSQRTKENRPIATGTTNTAMQPQYSPKQIISTGHTETKTHSDRTDEKTCNHSTHQNKSTAIELSLAER